MVVTPTTPTTSATWDRTSRSSATGIASKAMRLYVRRDVSAEQWLTDLEPHLSPAARQAYEGTDPAHGAPIKITGRPKLLDGGSGYLAKVHIMTNEGTYLVLLSRENGDAPWRVERFTPPEDVGH